MCNFQAAKYSSNIGPSEQIKLIVYWKEVYLFCLWPVLHVLIYINPCTLRTSNCWTVLTFLRALVLLALKDLYFILIAIQLFMAFGGETVGQQIDKLSKYWWHLEFFLRQRCIRYHLINLRLIMQFLGFYFSLWIHSCVTDYYKQEILLLLLQDNKTKCVHFSHQEIEDTKKKIYKLLIPGHIRVKKLWQSEPLCHGKLRFFSFLWWLSSPIWNPSLREVPLKP